MGIYRFSDKIIDARKYPWGYSNRWSPLSEGSNLIAYFGADQDSVIFNESDNKISKWHDKGPLNLTATPVSANIPLYNQDGKYVDAWGDRAVLSWGTVAASLVVVCCRFTTTRDYSSLLGAHNRGTVAPHT
jgi:hypothetical protein